MNTPMDIVSIQSIDKAHESGLAASPLVPPEHDHRHRGIIIGASIGAAAFLLIVVTGTILAIRMRRRHRTKVREESQRPHVYEGSVEPPGPVGISTQEIGNNSLIWPFREVPYNGVVELPERTSPSDNHSQSSRASRILRPIAYALQGRRDSQLNTPSDMRDLRRIHLSTTMSRSSRANNPSSVGTLGTETVIFTSPKLEDFDPEVASITTSNTKKAIFSSYMRKPLDLNRSLPPTPISESPQCSPIVARFDRGSSSQEHPLKAPTNSYEIMSAFTSPRYPISSFFPRGRRPVGLLLDDARFNDSTSTWGTRHPKPPTKLREGWE